MAAEPLHLVLGASGQVGHELVRQLVGVARVVGLSRPEISFENLRSVRDAIRLHRPSVIWNAAAATAVEALEQDPVLAEQVNAKAPGVIAEEALRARAILVHFSTDYVFDGTKAGPYVEADAPNPLNVYGRSKLAGEQAIGASGSRHLILRTSWVYSGRGRNFVRSILARAGGTERLRIVCDQVGAPTWSREIAGACARIAPQLEDKVESGVLHMTALGSCSWFDFATALQEDATRRGIAWCAGLDPVTTEEYAGKVRRPLNSVLSNSALLARFGVSLPHWRASLAEFWQSGWVPPSA
jgi:dTDP-4-dehydrorhamnose reductase